jgi:uncharacterized membrane protein
LGINSSGTIIGNRSPSLIRRLLAGQVRHTRERGYLLSHGTIEDLGGFVYAINDQREAVGGSASQGKTVATVFKNGRATVILSLPSFAVGINSAADVVGSYQPAGNDRRHLFLWSADSGAFDLTPEGYRSAEAAAINDRGEVLGFGETVSGTSQYFLLKRDSSGLLAPKPLASAPPPSAG